MPRLMSQKKLVELLTKAGVVHGNDHFVLTSGRHSSDYVAKDSIALHPGLMDKICREIAKRVYGKGVEAVVGPAVAGVGFAQMTALHLSRLEGREVFSAWADKGNAENDPPFIIGRTFPESIKGKKVLVVEDIVTTGGSAKGTVDAVRAVGGEVVEVIFVWNRGNITSDKVGGVSVDSLITLALPTYPEADCPLCREGVKINQSLGHGKKYLAEKSQQKLL